MEIPDDFLDVLPKNSMHFRGEVVLKCTGCGLPLLDRMMLKLGGRLWHAGCLRCMECATPLTEKCYERNDLNFCEEHFYRKFGTRCGGCDQGILPLETIRRVRHLVFHLRCFVCLVCGRELITGDHFYLVDDKRLVCQEDYTANKGGKRPRTSILSSQLEALRETYRITPKPSRTIREQLARDTGLDMRVVQVWFQNRRAKEKRLKKEVKKSDWENKKFEMETNSIMEEEAQSSTCFSASDLRFAFLQQIIYLTQYKQQPNKLEI